MYRIQSSWRVRCQLCALKTAQECRLTGTQPSALGPPAPPQHALRMLAGVLPSLWRGCSALLSTERAALFVSVACFSDNLLKPVHAETISCWKITGTLCAQSSSTSVPLARSRLPLATSLAWHACVLMSVFLRRRRAHGAKAWTLLCRHHPSRTRADVRTSSRTRARTVSRAAAQCAHCELPTLARVPSWCD